MQKDCNVAGVIQTGILSVQITTSNSWGVECSEGTPELGDLASPTESVGGDVLGQTPLPDDAEPVHDDW